MTTMTTSLFNVLLVVACATIATTTVRGDLAASPVSTAAILGQTVSFDCTGAEDNDTEHAYTWLFNQMTPTPVTIVYNCQVNPDYSNLYDAVVTEDNGCRLSVRNVAYTSAGTYTCQHAFDQAAADLVVLNSNSSCSFGPTDVATGESITITCVLNYNGPRSPKMNFKSETGIVYDNATINTFPNQVNGRVTFPVYPPTTRAATANTFFDSPIDFLYTWTLPTLLVQFPPSNVQVDVAGESCDTYYSNYTVLTCTADAWPPATFRWLDVDTGDSYNGPTITLTKLGQNNFRCVVENDIRDIFYNATRDVSVDISDGVPSTCPTEPETTQTEPTTTPEPTTTSPPTTTTTIPTTSFIPINECGSRFRVAPPEAPIASGWNLMCYINRTDTRWLDTQCIDLLQNLPPDIGDYSSLTSRGGSAGCSFLTGSEDIWTGADIACFAGYQINLALSQCGSCTRLAMCIRLPPTYFDNDSE